MNQRAVIIALAVVSLGLGRCYSSPPGHVPPEEGSGTATGSAKPRQGVSSTVMLTQDLEACEAQLEEMNSTMGAKPSGNYGAEDKVRVKVKVVHDGDPKKCAGAPPPIEAVASTECQEGMVCLDDKAQRALAKNLAAYEAWVAKVTACEK